MEIRSATDNDIPAIVNLLKKSLGETLMPKSAEYWKWKHIQNPFGRSPVLLCWEKSTLVGVRAFMRWQWVKNGKQYNAVRAVDTATHPDYQGKGIFRKLTLSLVNSCMQAGDHFIFNTPNDSSKPGYLKMGWIESGRLPVSFRICRLMKILQNLVVKPAIIHQSSKHPVLGDIFDDPALENIFQFHRSCADRLITNVHAAYLKWRYVDVPVVSYKIMMLGNVNDLRALIIGRLKETKFGNEFRITDLFVSQTCSSRELRDFLRQQLLTVDADYMTISGILPDHLQSCLKKISHINALKVGPVVTVRHLNFGKNDMLRNFNEWSPTLGDLELF